MWQGRPNVDVEFTKNVQKRKKLLVVLPQSFVYAKCSSMTAGIVTMKKLCDGVEMVKGFFYLSDRLNASGGSETAVPARTKIG